MRRVRITSLALVLCSCYEYRQVDPSAQLSGGTYVRVELTDNGTARVTPAIGPYALAVEGAVQAVDAQGLTLSLQSVTRRGEGESKWNGETLALDRADIRGINERHTARGRTAMVATASVAAGAALLIAIARATGLVSGSGGKPPVPGT